MHNVKQAFIHNECKCNSKAIKITPQRHDYVLPWCSETCRSPLVHVEGNPNELGRLHELSLPPRYQPPRSSWVTLSSTPEMASTKPLTNRPGLLTISFEKLTGANDSSKPSRCRQTPRVTRLNFHLNQSSAKALWIHNPQPKATHALRVCSLTSLSATHAL